MIRAEERTARRPYRCDGCGGRIERGERYRHSVASPYHDDLGNPTWWRLRSCSECAARLRSIREPQEMRDGE